MPTKVSIIKNISFFSDGFKLKGTLHLPSTHRPPVVIGSHGLYSSSGSPKQIALADHCNQLGIAYFRFDHRGCGASAGKFEEVTSREARCRDLSDAMAAIAGLKETEVDQIHLANRRGTRRRFGRRPEIGREKATRNVTRRGSARPFEGHRHRNSQNRYLQGPDRFHSTDYVIFGGHRSRPVWHG